MGSEAVVKVLDHGSVKKIAMWGSDEQIVEAARMSTDRGFLGWGPKPCQGCGREYAAHPNGHAIECKDPTYPPGDEKLLSYLWKHRHTTPFEMAGAVFEVQAPIFVFREWQRHRTQSFNEMSARYIPLPDVNYVPSVERLMNASSSQNRQQQVHAGVLSESGAEGVQGLLTEIYGKLEHSYQHMLNNGVPKELARLIIPVGRYSRMRAGANLLNWLRFLGLRNAPDAQYEIRVYAETIASMLAERFPRVMALAKERPL